MNKIFKTSLYVLTLILMMVAIVSAVQEEKIVPPDFNQIDALTNYIFLSDNVSKLWSDKTFSNINTKEIIEDVNGDLLSDVLIVDNGSRVLVKRGKDGLNLWSIYKTDSRIRAFSAGDLNGDKRNDVLVDIYNSSSDKWTIAAKRGDNGATIWSLEHPGHLANGIYSSRDIYPANDLDGDKLNDVILLDSVLYSIIDNYGYPNYWKTLTLKALRGKNGSTIWQTERKCGDENYGYWYDFFFCGLWPYPAGDLNGDGNNDLLYFFEMADPSGGGDYGPYKISTVKGKDGSLIWGENGYSMPFKYPFNAVPASNDLNGDKKKDVLDPDTEIYYDYYFRVRHGLNGSTIWQIPHNWDIEASGSTLNDADGDRTADVIIVFSNGTVEIRKGNDGTLLSRRSWTGSPKIKAHPAGDLDRDGLEDVVIEFSENISSVWHTYLTVISPNDDRTLWFGDYSSTKSEYNTYIADLDANGINDIVTSSIIYNSDGSINRYEITARRGKDGAELWKAISFEKMDLHSGNPKVDKDLNADGDGDVLFVGNNTELYALTTINIRDWLAPRSITGLKNVTFKPTYINWTWIDPTNSDFSGVKVYINGVWKANVPKGKQLYNAADLMPNVAYRISTRTFDTNGNVNLTWVNHSSRTAKDSIPPASITGLRNITYKRTYINWTWIDPASFDFSRVKVYINGVWKTDVPKGKKSYNATGLLPNTVYTISTRTVDTSGNVNITWVNRSARTAP